MPEVRNRHVQDVVELLGDQEIRNDLLRVFAERLVDLKRGRRVRVRHLKVVLCDRSSAQAQRLRGKQRT